MAETECAVVSYNKSGWLTSEMGQSRRRRPATHASPFRLAPRTDTNYATRGIACPTALAARSGSQFAPVTRDDAYWWSKPLKELRMATFNARAETVETKPVFRDAFKRTRCLIPMSGYYETPSRKQPWYFTARDGYAPWLSGEAGAVC
jgi:putative SOS response-associated peptidase YedK